jgi:hypothetical protein
VNHLQAISEETLARFDEIHPAVEDEVTDACVREDAPQRSMGLDAKRQVKAGMGFVSGMLSAAMAFGSKEILAGQMAWGREALPVRGVSMDMVRRNLERYRDALRRRLAASAFAEVQPYLDATIARLGEPPPDRG